MTRRNASGSRKLSQSVVDVLVSLWINPEDPLIFTQIHKGLVKKGKVKDEKYRTSTIRILRKAENQNLITHEDNSRLYFLNVVPDEFRIFNYLETLRQKGETVKLHFGGSLWSLCQIYLLGMPKSALKYPNIRSILQVLGTRILMLFESFRILSQELKKREIMPHISNKIPPLVARELMLELIPYYLGSRAGSDFDGLSFEDLNVVLPKMIQALPEEVESQNPTRKDLILEHFQSIKELMKQKEIQQEDEEESILEENPRDFALVIIPPEESLDEDWHERRSIKQILEDYKEKSPLYIASELLPFEKENVLKILEIYGKKILDFEKLYKTKKIYEKMYASDYIATLIIHSFEYYPEEEKRKAMKIIEELSEKHGFKPIIVYMAFSRSSKIFRLPTPEKEKILKKFFPRHSEQAIHEWLSEGAALAKEVYEEKIKDLESIFMLERLKKE